jgi:hypothetical protein
MQAEASIATAMPDNLFLKVSLSFVSLGIAIHVRLTELSRSEMVLTNLLICRVERSEARHASTVFIVTGGPLLV